jgi:hypothetical protein
LWNLLMHSFLHSSYTSARVQILSACIEAEVTVSYISKPGLVMWDFVMDKSVAGAGFLRELWFPLPIYIPSTSPQSSSLSPEADTIGQEWPQC